MGKEKTYKPTKADIEAWRNRKPGLVDLGTLWVPAADLAKMFPEPEKKPSKAKAKK